MKTIFTASAAVMAAISAAFFLTPVKPARAQASGTAFTVRTGLVPPLRGMVSAGGKGFLVEPPQLIADTGVQEVRVSSEGSRAIILRRYFRPTPNFLLSGKNSNPNNAQDVPGESSVTIWNAVTRKASVVWRQRIEPGTSLSFHAWGVLHSVNSPDRVLVGVSFEKPQEGIVKPISQQTLLLVDTEKNIVRQITLSPADLGYGQTLDFVIPEPSPRLPFAALSGPRGAVQNLLRFLRPDGSLTNPITLPGEISWRGWQNNGTVLRGVQIIPSPTDPKITTRQWFDADPQTRTLTPIDPPKTRPSNPEPPAPETIPQLTLTTRPPLPQSGTQEASVWLQAKSEGATGTAEGVGKKAIGEAILLCAEGKPVFLLPRAALFLSNGALYAAPIQTVSEPTLAQIRQKQKRDADARLVKQIGLGIMMYLQDNDIKYPPSASGLSQDIGAYLGNAGILTGFVYTPPAQRQSEMTNVAEVVLGWLPGDGGKTVLYADGHVKWQDNP